jgi:glycine cleavage system regulatory protein
MLAAALIPYAPGERNFTLQDLLAHLTTKLGLECTLTEAEEYDEPLLEIRVATRTPLSIRIQDDAELVHDDLGDLAEDGEGVLPIAWFDAP